MTMITRPKTRAIPTTPKASPYSASATIAPQPANTSAKAAIPSARARRPRSGRGIVSLGWRNFVDQRVDPPADLAADAADRVEVLAGRILELPVLVPLPWIGRARVPATHRDHSVRRAHGLVGKRLRELLLEIPPDLGHRGHHIRVEVIGRIAARRAHMNSPAGQLVEETGGHLAAPRVVDADKEHLRDSLIHAARILN